MNLDELVYKRFIEDENLAKCLTKYAGKPAVFNGKAPDDRQSGWGGKTHYPRLTFSYDLQADGERKSAGTLNVSVLCQLAEQEFPEEIVPDVIEALKDVLIHTEDDQYFAFAWARNDSFDMPEQNELIAGCDVRFDLVEYPEFETLDLDPVLAMSRWLKKEFPEALVIGVDRFEGITVTSKEKPVLYCRIISNTMDDQTNTIDWMNVRLVVYVLCPDGKTRRKIAAAIAQRMSLAGEVTMTDDSPMTVEQLEVSYQTDYVRSGMVFPTCRYGIFRYRALQPNLRNPHTKVENEEDGSE